MDYQQFRAMNSDIILAAEGSQDSLTLGFKLARDFINASEVRFTRFTDFSELSCLNRTAGAWFQASPELFQVVQMACEYAAETEGLFDPTMLAALEAAGYDKSMDDIRADGVSSHGVPPQSRSIYSTRSAFRAIQLDEPTHSIRLPLNTRIDLGGIAKGWIAEQAALILSEYATACAVSAGGDMFLVGLPADEPSWSIGLEDPRAPDRDLTTLHIGPGAVATSSIAKRRWQQGRRTQHHIIDPRTGLPAETDWVSVSVIAPHAALAEVYAKALLIGGSREAERIAAQRPEITYVAVDQDGQLCGQTNLSEVLDVYVENV